MTKSPLNDETERLIAIYRDRVLPLQTRRVTLLGRKCKAVLMKTFLGYELQLGRKRITCPDLITARYLRIFAELGVRTIEIPYNPTRTASILPDLEESFATTQQIIQEEAGEKSDAKRWVRQVYARIRAGLAEARND